MGIEIRVWRVLVACLMLGTASEAAAQIVLPWNDRGFVQISGGAQTKARTYTVTGSTPLYGEDATFEAPMATGNGSIIDIGGGMKLIDNLAVGLTYSRYSDSYSSPVTASVPDPLFFDSPHPSSLSVSGLHHTESAVHLSGAVVLPVSERLEVIVFGGPTFFSLSKDMVSEIAVAPGGTTLQSAATTRVSASSVGIHVGGDVTYLAWRLQDLGLRLGVGLFLRHSAGSVDVSSVDGGNVDVGGFNYGAGVRVRF